MDAYYDGSYFWSHEGYAVSQTPADVINIRKAQLEAKAACLGDMKPGLLLDIGASKGEFQWFMAQRGWRTEGAELSERVPNLFGQAIRYGDFLEMEFPEAAYDCITMWAVLEHVYRPKAYVEKVARLLRPGGRFVALVTNFNSVQARIFRADDYPRHLTFFTRRSIRRLLDANNLNTQKMWTDQKVFGGALNGGLVLLLKLLSGYSTDEAFKEWRQLRDPLLYYCNWHGKPSSLVRTISRVDRAITLPLEKVLDKIGCGFNLCVVAEKG